MLKSLRCENFGFQCCRTSHFYDLCASKAAPIQKNVDSQNFVKVFLADFLVALGILNSKSVSVVCYILENVRYSDNTLIASKQEIADGCRVSVRTVYYVMSKLEEVGFIKKKSNRLYIVNPKYIVKGNENKRRMIIDYYNNDESTAKND